MLDKTINSDGTRCVPAPILGLIVDLFCFFVQHHSYRIKYYLLRSHMVGKVKVWSDGGEGGHKCEPTSNLAHHSETMQRGEEASPHLPTRLPNPLVHTILHLHTSCSTAPLHPASPLPPPCRCCVSCAGGSGGLPARGSASCAPASQSRWGAECKGGRGGGVQEGEEC